MKKAKKEKGARTRGSHVITSFFDIPEDTIGDVPRIILLGDGRLYVEGHRGMLEYTQTRIRLRTATAILSVEGERLMLEEITPENTMLVGRIDTVGFLRAR
nr:YabP/YqfC family sporulation protein [Maliibacterium massiliense]